MIQILDRVIIKLKEKNFFGDIFLKDTIFTFIWFITSESS